MNNFAPSTNGIPKPSKNKIIKGKEFWGPILWSLIHLLAMELKFVDIKYYITLLNTLTYLLPCEDCKNHLSMTLAIISPNKYIKEQKNNSNKCGNTTAFLYSYALHDVVNSRLGKESVDYLKIYNFYFGACKEPKMWGPIVWASIHILAATLRQENADAFDLFLDCLVHLLPSNESQTLFSDSLKVLKPGPYLSNNQDAFLYSYALHDLINEKLGKESPNYNEIKTFYFRGLSQECKECNV